ncbi:selenocysteine-specific translation elongation factor [Humibacillus xanthopallidus]|uniref:Selenocysteine-specific elongation factor n=1 Tax=Humibacillus xanthopallidus TaxID=412689 RepID=A0A543HG52_9MICO|nr:selenocysteine-specific translation elongation factor [Humibacillus xanthopallidus]TQM57309.1 selenocysteine-specific elongation factor [Humibacillus xanthopallidus]
MHVIATAGHVDHGKSTLVRALTGIEPDRWAEEHRRGMTIDLGYAWTTLAPGVEVAFVDVPGHERFIGNMLAGLGPAPAVVLVVAADEGWRRQSAEHLAAVDALGITHGLLVVTRSDLADPEPAMAQAVEQLGRTSLAGSPALAVSARTGQGLGDLRAALGDLVATLPPPETAGRTRLWVDRSFSIRGSGTVVTGTLGAGTIRVGDDLLVHRASGATLRATVRGLQSLEQPCDAVSAVARVAVNLRGVRVDEVGRGDALLTPDAWHVTRTVDVRLTTDSSDETSPGARHRPQEGDRLPAHLMVHAGTLAVEARVRPLGPGAVRLGLSDPLPLAAGDRVVLRDPGSRRVVGALVVDADPPRLDRRGAAARRAVEVAVLAAVPDLAREVARRGWMRHDDAVSLGIVVPAGGRPASTVARRGGWLVDDDAWQVAGQRLRAAVERRAESTPIDPGVPLEAARASAGLPDRALVTGLAEATGLEVRDGRVGLPGHAAALGDRAEAALRAVEARLREHPFTAPEQHDLDAAGLGARELAAAQGTGRILRLPGEIVLLPSAPALAMRELARLPQPFTTSDARQALGSTRRTVVPLLEHLDGRGWTRRLDGSHREVVRARPASP